MRRLSAIVLGLVLTLVAALVADGAWGFWSTPSAAGGHGASAAASVNQGATPTGSATGQSVTVSWAASTLSTGQPVSGYLVGRYDAATLTTQTVLAGCSGTITATTCTETGVPGGSWTYTVTPVVGSSWQGPESGTSATVVVTASDTTPPANSITLSSVTGGAYLSGATVYYRGSAAGSFRVTNAVSDAGSGPASSTTDALTGSTTGWTHTPSTVTTPAGGPYVSNPYTWASSTGSAPQAPVTGSDVTGNTALTTLSLVDDSTAPSPGAVSYADGYASGSSVSVTFTSGADADSGIATRRLQRASAALTSGSCGSFGSFADVGPASPTSPYVNGMLATGCYQYRLVVTDRVGNQDIATSANVAKVGYSGAVAGTTGLLGYWRLGEALSISPALDSKGTNNGIYWLLPTVGVAGAIAGDTDTAVQLDGWDDHVTVARQISDDFSIELWFKSTQGIGTGPDWWSGAGLVDADQWGSADDFGVSLRSDGKVVAGVGNPDTSIVSSTGGFNDGGWHHVVFTRTRSSGALALYVDGAAQGTATGNTNALTATLDVYFGRIRTLGNNLAGSLDEIAVYTTVLSPTTIADHYQLGSGATDTSGPSGGSVDASGLVGTGSRYSASTSVSIAFDAGTDPSDVAQSGAQLLRASATLTEGSCGSFGSYALVTGGTDPVSPLADTVADQACYRYRYVVADTLGNSTTYTSGDVKVDATAPDAPTLGFSAFTNTYWPGSGSTVYYRSAAASGSVSVTASASDATSGIASYAFAALGTNWSSSPGPTGVNTYSWSGAPPAPGAASVTATNNATLGSGDASFTMTVDDSAPTSGTVSYADTTQSSTSVSVSFTTGTDDGSGLGTRLLQRASATLSGTTCGSYGSFATVPGGTDPASPFTDTVTPASCNKYQYVVSDHVGNTTTVTSDNVVRVEGDYFATVNATPGLVSHYRLGEAITSADSMTGSSGATLQSRDGETAASWTKYGFNDTDAVLTPAGRLRKNGASITAFYYASAAPASADYTVEADIYVASNLANDLGGVVGRVDTSSAFGTYYLARYEQATHLWSLFSVVNNSWSWLGGGGQTLTAGSTYRVALDMSGTRIRLLVNGVEIASVTDSSITAAGRGGLMLGGGASTTVDDSTGLHLDNFRVSPPAADSMAANPGTYLGGVTLGTAGAINGDADTAASFDGANAFSTIARQISDDFSIEFWFKSTQGIGTGSDWWSGAGLVDGDVSGSADDFGVSLRSDGKVVAGVGNPDTSIVSGTGGFNDGGWHHVVFTRTRSSGALALYVDGAAQGTATGNTNALTAPSEVSFGRIRTGGNYLVGSLDEIAFYTTVLSQATVSSHHQLGGTGP